MVYPRPGPPGIGRGGRIGRFAVLVGIQEMRPFPTDPDEILSAPFLPEPDWSGFTRKLFSAIERIGHSHERILVAERDPVAFVAVVMAGICRGCDLFLASPDWRDREWEQVSETADFHRIFGDCPLRPRRDEPVAGSCRIMIPTGGSSGSLRFCVHTPGYPVLRRAVPLRPPWGWSPEQFDLPPFISRQWPDTGDSRPLDPGRGKLCPLEIPARR